MNKAYTFLVDLDHTLYDVEKGSLYSDAIGFVDFLTNHGKTILFTEGEVSFQKEKVSRLNLKKHFSSVRIFDSYSKMSETVNDYKDEKIVLIDDNPEVVEEANKRGWVTIRIKRGKYENVSSKSDYLVSDLNSIKKFKIFEI